MSTYPEAIPSLEQRIEWLREFEREYNGRLRAYFTAKLGELNGTGEVLDVEQRRRVDAVRRVLAGWELPDAVAVDPARASAAVRALLEVIDQVAPKGEAR